MSMTAGHASDAPVNVLSMGTPLLGEDIAPFTEEMDDKEVENMSPFRVWAVLMNIIIGLGFLSIPYCFNSGLGTNTLVLLFIGLFTYLSFILLIDASLRAETTMDYTKLMRLSFPALQWVPALLIFLTLFGQGALHFQFWYKIISTMVIGIEKLGDKRPWYLNRWFLIFVPPIVFCLPLTFLRNVKAYSQVSLLTCLLIVLTLVHAIVVFAQTGFHRERKFPIFTINKYFISSLSTQAFAFHCHPGVGPAISKLINPSRNRQYMTMAIVVGAGAVCYYVGGIIPYLTLASIDKPIDSQVIFESYQAGPIFTYVTEALYALFLLITTPLLLYAARVALHDLISTNPPSDLVWSVVGIVVLLAATVLAVVVKSIDTMFDLIGGVTISGIIYILPPVFYLKICHGDSLIRTIVAWVMISIGITTICVCTYHAVLGFIHPDKHA
jgi:amino acid permease